MIITCGIIEDEILGRELLTRYISRVPMLQLNWVKETLSDLLSHGVDQRDFVDLVFLDLQSAVQSGSVHIDQAIEKYGHIIVTTAYPEKFVRTLPIHFLSILNKPFSFETFKRALTEAQTVLDLHD